MTKFLRAERGQAVFIMVFVLVGLLAMLGLAIDGGTVFLERRRMQNAADAAALAGTRLLAEAICGATEVITDGLIAEQVNHYAEINGVPSGNVVADYVDFDEEVVGDGHVGHVSDGKIPERSTGISVTVEISRSTHFVTLIGIDTAGASADALAMTGPLLATGGLRPIGLPVEVVEDLGPGGELTINMENNCDDDNCTVQYIRDDGEGVTHAHRGWLNLHYVWKQDEDPDFPRALDANIGTGWGGPQHEGLMDWMLTPPQIVLYADCPWDSDCREGDYVAAKPGLSWGAMTGGGSESLCEQISDEISILPVYDAVPACAEVPDPKPACSPQGGQSVGYVYHIIGFSVVYITGCDQGAGGVHNIHMEIVEVILGQGQINPTVTGAGYGEGNACQFNVQVVTLWK